MNKFKQFLLKNRKRKHIRLFFDVETLQYNEAEGREKPSQYKNIVYAVGVGYEDSGTVKTVLFPNFKHFFDVIIDTYKKWKRLPRINLIAHNTNKYDNHFLRHDLIYFYNLPYKNLYLKNANHESNRRTLKKKDISRLEKEEGLILEKRIKSSNNLELNFYLNNIEFYVTDNLIKTNQSIEKIGKKLLQLGLINEDYLKTDYDYEKYNRDYDMTDEEAYSYALKVFEKLTTDEKIYIRNDIIILAMSVIHYNKLYKGFDYSKITFTTNILDYYNDNELTSYQLLKSIGKGKTKEHVKYTDYHFHNENLYDYIKSFYSGGMNLYNDNIVGEIIEDDIIAVDINSSYPYAMHKYKVPTFISQAEHFEKETNISVPPFNEDEYFLYRTDKKTFDREITYHIKSDVIRKMIVKYYSGHDYVNINTFTIRILREIVNIKIEQLPVLSYIKFDCEYFASRDKIASMYEVKEKGASKKKLIYNSPYDITITNEDNNEVFSRDEIDITKVILNGLYGIPALRSHFNIFRWLQNDELKNFENGYKNNERNIAFSVFVTSVAFYNLLLPFKKVPPTIIDDSFLYCDTDSLYYKKKMHKRVNKNIFDKHELGKWSIDNDNIKKFVVLNHKKYAYAYDKKGKLEIEVKCGGVPLDSFKTENISFSEFVEKQFSDGVVINNKKAIFNKQGTISIYPSKTELQIGKPYMITVNNPLLDDMKKRMLEEIRQEKNSLDDVMYIESNLGTFSQSDLYPINHETSETLPIDYLIIDEELYKNRLTLH